MAAAAGHADRAGAVQKQIADCTPVARAGDRVRRGGVAVANVEVFQDGVIRVGLHLNDRQGGRIGVKAAVLHSAGAEGVEDDACLNVLHEYAAIDSDSAATTGVDKHPIGSRVAVVLEVRAAHSYVAATLGVNPDGRHI